MAKTICFSKIQLCVTSHNYIFWVLDNFYCHKNFMGSYYTLYTVFYHSFYVPNIIKIPVLIGFYSLWLKLKKTGLNWFQPVAVPVFRHFWIRQPVAVAVCPFLGQWTGPANTTPIWMSTTVYAHDFCLDYLLIVFEGLVWSSFSAWFWWTATATGFLLWQDQKKLDHKKPDQTA